MISLRADETTSESLQKIIDAQIDVTGAKHVEILSNKDGSVVWVNVNGICLLRICQIKELSMRYGK